MDAYEKELQHLIDIFNPPPPKMAHIPQPNFKLDKHPQLSEDRYWDIEQQRWVEGYWNERGEFISGSLYYYIQNAWLNNNDGEVFHPKWRDTDELMDMWAFECLRDERSLLVYKKRDCGATSYFGNLPFYFMRTFPGCKIGITGKDQRNINAMFNDKILFTYNRFNPKVLNTIPVQLNNTTQKSALTVSLKVFDEDTQQTDTRTSIILTSETSEKPDSPNNLSGNRFKYVYVDEAALHKKIEPFLGSIFPALNRGHKRTGLLVMAGTIEPNLTSAEVSKFYELIQKTKNLNVRSEMVPVWLGLFEKNGYSNEAAGLLWYEHNVKKFEDAGDNAGKRAFKMQYPRNQQDIFEFSQGGMLEDDVNDILVATQKKLIDEGCPEAPYKLIPSGTGFEATPDTKSRPKDDQGNYLEGGFWIIEPPKQGLIYYVAIDGISTGKQDGEEKGSWMASMIYKGFDPSGGDYEPVGFYFERPKTVELGYIYTINLFKFYNKFGGVKEINFETAAATGSHFATFLEKEGLIKYAMKRKDLSGLGYSNKNKLGTPVNEDTLEWQIRQANMFLRKYGRNIRSKLLIQHLLKPANENADLRSAFFNFMTCIPNFEKKVEKKIAPREISRVVVVRNADGSTSYKTEKRVVQNRHEEEVGEFEAYINQLKAKYGEAYWYNNATGEEKQKYISLKGSPN
jgi:hypothetical protein